MERPKLLIADNNEEFRLALARLLQSRYDVRTCCTGGEALAILHQDHWDVLVLDVMLPEVDGITLLERITEDGIRPKVLLLTSLTTDYILRAAERLGVGYIMLKSCEVQAAAARIFDLNQTLNPPARKQDPEVIVSDLLTSMQFAPKLKGFDYLKPAIALLEQDRKQPITKVLYPAVAEICSCESGHVERSIRHAIEKTWDRRDVQVWEHYFPGLTKRPANAVFLARMAEALHQALE